jgi:RNA polymerase sigma-70 factor (ECF subfamily)
MIPTESQSRAWMVAWLQSSDQTVGQALIKALYPFVVSVISKHIADQGAIEDLTQQTFVRFFSKAGQWNPHKPLEPWLARIAINVCRDHYRERQTRRELRWSDLTEREQVAMEATLQNREGPSDILNEESRTLIFRLLDTLKADERMVLSLLYFEDRTTDQIAKICGWNRALVKVRAFRARRKLRQAFERLERLR